MRALLNGHVDAVARDDRGLGLALGEDVPDGVHEREVRGPVAERLDDRGVVRRDRHPHGGADEPPERATELLAGLEEIGRLLGRGEDQVERRVGRPRRRYHGQNAERQHRDEPWDLAHAIAPPRLSADARRLVHVGVLSRGARAARGSDIVHPFVKCLESRGCVNRRCDSLSEACVPPRPSRLCE